MRRPTMKSDRLQLPPSEPPVFPEPREFLAALKHKAGLAADFWSPEMNVSRYGVTKWTERDFAWSE